MLLLSQPMHPICRCLAVPEVSEYMRRRSITMQPAVALSASTHVVIAAAGSLLCYQAEQRVRCRR